MQDVFALDAPTRLTEILPATRRSPTDLATRRPTSMTIPAELQRLPAKSMKSKQKKIRILLFPTLTTPLTT